MLARLGAYGFPIAVPKICKNISLLNVKSLFFIVNSKSSISSLSGLVGSGLLVSACLVTVKVLSIFIFVYNAVMSPVTNKQLLSIFCSWILLMKSHVSLIYEACLFANGFKK